MAQNVEYILTLRDRFSKNLKRANRSIEQLERNSKGLQNTLSALTPFLGMAAVGAGVKNVIQLGIEMEQTRVAFTTFLKDADKANKLISDLNEFANVTPFNNQEVIKSGRVLLAANVPAEKIRETLRQIGDISAGANVPLNDMAAIYSKAMNKGRLQAEELNQLAERGVPILQTFADMFGVTTQEVMKMGSQGQLSSDLMNQAFAKMTNEGGIFFNLMEKQSATLGGKISTIQGKFQLLGSQIGENNEVIKKYADRVIELIDVLIKNQDTIEKIIKITGQAIKLWVVYKTTIFAYSKAIKVATVANNLYRFATIATNRGLKSAIRLTKTFNATMKANVIGLVVAGLGLLITKLGDLRRKSKEVTDQQRKLNEQLEETRRLTTSIKDLDTKFKNLNLLTKEQKEELLEITKTQKQQIENTLTNIKLYAKESKEYERIVELRKQFNEAANANVKGLIAGDLREAERQLNKSVENRFGTTFNEAQRQSNLLQRRINTLQKNIGAKSTQEDGIITPDEEAKRLEQTITSAAPKVFNINITKLIETQEINTTTLKESSTQIKKQIIEALLEGLNETQTMIAR